MLYCSDGFAPQESSKCKKSQQAFNKTVFLSVYTASIYVCLKNWRFKWSIIGPPAGTAFSLLIVGNHLSNLSGAERAHHQKWLSLRSSPWERPTWQVVDWRFQSFGTRPTCYLSYSSSKGWTSLPGKVSLLASLAWEWICLEAAALSPWETTQFRSPLTFLASSSSTPRSEEWSCA